MRHNDLFIKFQFNFGFIERLNGDDNAYRFRDVIEGWVNAMPPAATANWVLGNHDKPRVASRYGPDRHDVLLTIQMTLPGVAVTYNVIIETQYSHYAISLLLLHFIVSLRPTINSSTLFTALIQHSPSLYIIFRKRIASATCCI